MSTLVGKFTPAQISIVRSMMEDIAALKKELQDLKAKCPAKDKICRTPTPDPTPVPAPVPEPTPMPALEIPEIITEVPAVETPAPKKRASKKK